MKLFPLIILFSINIPFFTTANALPENLLESSSLVKAGNKYITLLGRQLNVGDPAPNFKVVDNNFASVELGKFKGKTILISVVPSLDTGICSLQTKRFNEEVANFGKNIIMLTISNDLPFAQKRFCKAESIDGIEVLSDSVWRDFGSKYGLLIKDMGLLTRAIIIINSQGKIAYKELVADISQHPDYTRVLVKLKALSLVNTLDNINAT
jgi:thiol peroxidase